MSKNIKKIIIILVILILIGIGASLFTGSGGTGTQNQLQSLGTGTTGAPLTQNAATSQALMDTEEINREFLSMLLNLESIRLEDDIFSEPAFQALVDNTIRLNQPGNEGRPNPFAPIGTDGLYGSSASAETNLEASASSAFDSLNTQNEETTITAEGANSSAPVIDATSSDQLSDEELQQGLTNLGNS